MRYLSTIALSISLLPLSLVNAGEPDVKTSPPAQTAQASSAPASATAPAVAVNAAADTAKDGDQDGPIKRLRARGYRPKMVNGTTMYCRGEAVLGSRFEKQRCGTADDLDKATRDSQNTVGDIQRSALTGSPGGH
jgi:hypothetical protein